MQSNLTYHRKIKSKSCNYHYMRQSTRLHCRVLATKHASKCRLTDRQCLEIPFGKRVSICGALNTGGHYRYCPPKILSRISYACVRFLAERANYPVNPDPQSFYGSSIRRRWDCACTASFPISALFCSSIVIILRFL